MQNNKCSLTLQLGFLVALDHQSCTKTFGYEVKHSSHNTFMTHLEMSLINVTYFQMVFNISVLVRILWITDGKVGFTSLFAPVVMHSIHRSNYVDFKKTSCINGIFITILKTQSVLKEYLLLKAGIIFYPTTWNPILCGNEFCVSKKCVFINCQYLYMRIYIILRMRIYIIFVTISRGYTALNLDVIYSLMEHPLIVMLRVK